MARLTRKQQEWYPGKKKEMRSIKVMFASTVLTLEALVAFFGTLAAYGLFFNDATWIKTLVWVLGLALVLAFLVTPALLKKTTWGYTLGWVLQVLLILVGLIVPMMLFVGVCFALTWWYAVHTGEKLDRENIQRAREQEEWERNNPVEAQAKNQ